MSDFNGELNGSSALAGNGIANGATNRGLGQVIVITSGKGGVGKTTTTASIGAALALKGKRVLVADAGW